MSDDPKHNGPGPLDSRNIDRPIGRPRVARSNLPTRPYWSDGVLPERMSRSTRPTRPGGEDDELLLPRSVAPLETPPTLLDAEPEGFCFGFYRDVSLVYWHSQATSEALRRLQGLTGQMLNSHPKGHSNVTFVRRGVALPTDEVRDAFTRVFDGRVSGLHCMSVIIEGEGFWASSLRSMITGLSMGAKTRVDVHLHGSIEEAAAWLAPTHSRATGGEFTAAELRSALRQAREQMARAVDAPALE